MVSFYILYFVNTLSYYHICETFCYFWLTRYIFLGCPKAINLLGQPCGGWTVRKAVGKFFGVTGPAGTRTCYP